MTSPNWQLYLQALEADASYNECRQFYTATQAEILLQVQTCVPSAEQQDEQNPTQQAKKAPERYEALAGLRTYVEQNEHVLLVGKPGSGKTTALRRLLWEDVNRGAADEAQRKQIPLLVELRGCRQGSVLDWLEKALMRSRLKGETLEDLLDSERILLLFDGLNELPTPDGWSELEDFRRDFATTPMIFTTRALGAGTDLKIQKKLEMVPLSETQMREFVQKRLPEQADNLLRQLDGRLRELAETPLLLAMLCEVFTQDGQIPKSRGELFRKKFTQQYAAFKPLRTQPVSNDFRRLAPKLLQHLAFEMMQGDPPTEFRLQLPKAEAETLLESYLTAHHETNAISKAAEYLEDLIKHHLLQLAVDPTEIEFHHQLFQEYYAAEALLLRLPTLSADQLNRDYLNYLKWTEPVAMMLALVPEEAQALRVVELALDDIDLILGSRLAGEVKPAFQSKTVGRVAALEIPELLKIELLERTRSDKAIPRLLKALEYPDFDVFLSATDVLGNLGSVETAPVLLEALKHPEFLIREIAAVALARSGNEVAIPVLLEALKRPDFLIREIAAFSMGNVKMLPDLIKASEDSESDTHLSEALASARMGSVEAIPALLESLEDPDFLIRERAVEELGKLSSPPLLVTLWQTRLKHPTGEDLRDAIASIQYRCKFYNYEIFQSRLEEEKAEISPSVGTTINIGSVGNLNTGAVTVQGNQIGTQNNPAAEPTE